MTLQEAITVRHSVRAYKHQPLAEDVVKALTSKIEEQNKLGRLHVQLVMNEPRAFSEGKAKYGRFRNVENYIVMAGAKADDLEERIGYHGEQIVLYAQTLGLNTCWVGLTYSKVAGTYVLDDGEVIKAYIAIGYGETGGTAHKVKRVEQVSNADAGSPEWFRRGVEAALLAPTAINQQKFYLEYKPVEEGRKARVVARRQFSLAGYTHIDIGIVRCHFEIAAGGEDYMWEEV